MFDAQCDLAALAYAEDQNPDEVLLTFCDDLRRSGFRPVGLVQHGHCRGQPADVSTLLIHTNEQIRLFQNLGSCAEGCRLDVGQLLTAGARVATAIDHGADLVVVNRFGRLEREGKGLSFLIEMAIGLGIPTVVAVPANRFKEWIKFSQGMSVKLACDAASLHRWWESMLRGSSVIGRASARCWSSNARANSLELGDFCHDLIT
ncbi:DUF2478 domain-containing protein [Bradyrhizobium sp. LHD-71]|uniref:DUF2478 domain-containing protein n=1 Tax=Bradyrhizobium sp. LHD-71 TaxID=3072141 RepID=UPI00280DA4E8|nr:DUF2478 domain-containing protein [Bradyrhizobium sp. LHD-71]MDQ8728509.1 DUF2478 domain-containing protein [Bradyrhizobium sp. LHD-71]